MIRMIAAVSNNGVIGKDGQIPWNYPEDTKLFRNMTQDAIVIMGRKTWESMDCKPLPKRENIIISRIITPKVGTTSFFSSLEKAFSFITERQFYHDMAAYQPDIWLIGGRGIYQEGMDCASEINLTIIPEVVTGENLVRMPWINPAKFKIENVKPLESDKRLQIVTYITTNNNFYK